MPRSIAYRSGFRVAQLAALLLSAAPVACAPAVDFQPHDDRFAECGARARATPTQDGSVTIAGTVRQVDDETPVDGPVRLVLVDSDGRLRKLYFGSLFTSPGPSEHRKATYRAIASSRAGDCVQVRGAAMPDGTVAMENFINLDRRQ